MTENAGRGNSGDTTMRGCDCGRGSSRRIRCAKSVKAEVLQKARLKFTTSGPSTGETTRFGWIGRTFKRFVSLVTGRKRARAAVVSDEKAQQASVLHAIRNRVPREGSADVRRGRDG